MASTPPPLPSSDEGEFDDDDFGCFTSSAPIKAGVDSESEDDAHHTKQEGHSRQKNSSENYISIKSQSHTVGNSDLGSDAPDIVCNGDQTTCVKEPSDSSSQPKRDSEGTEENLNSKPSTNEDQKSHSPRAVPDLSSDLHDSHDSNNCTPESCENETENPVDVSASETQGSGSSQQEELDDWADFSPAAPVNSSEVDQVKNLTVEPSATESFQPSDQNNQSLTSACVSAEVPDESDVQSGVAFSEVENSEPVNKTDEAIDNTCDNENDNENCGQQSEGEDFECRSDNVSGNQSLPESHFDVNSCREQETKIHTDVSDSAQGMKGSPNDSDREIANDDDDDFGDFSDFTSHKTKESSSKEDVAPISFRASTCEDDFGEEDEDHDDFTNDNAFTTHSGETGESPSPYEVDVEDDDDDWGFKAADDKAGQSSANIEDDFGDFGSSSNAAASDDANWADFSDSTTPIVATSDNVNELNEDELQSPASSMAIQTSSVQDGQSKLEKAVSSSFPHDQEGLFHQYAIKMKRDEKSESENEKEEGERNEDANALESVLEMGLKILPSAKQETWTITKEIRMKDPMVAIWEHLKDVNACHALDFGWNSSQCSQDVYNTLHIDTKNVLFSQKKQAVPFFASGLGILEPIRGGANPPEKQNMPPPLVDTRTQEESHKEPPQDIPPVNFDWSSSGLTDPLKVFKSDGFNSGLSSFEPFAEILQKSAAANQGSSDKELSQEARSILMKIPNLSFMQSKVLMFPIKDP